MPPANGASRPGGAGELSFWTCAFLTFGAGVVYFFWPSISTPFILLSGDAGDGRLLNAIVEHWYLVVRGSSSWRDMEMYFPHRGVLGYGDSLILFAPPYVAQRLAGVPFLYAYVGTLVVVLGTGFFSTVWLLRRVLGLGAVPAIVGAFLFAFSNMNMLKMGHAQLYASAFVPLVVGLVWRATAQLAEGQYFQRFATPLAIVLPLLMFTSFYVGWYTFLFLATWGASLLITKFLVDVRALKAFAASVFERRRAFVAPLVIFALALLPFVLTYLPVYREVGGRNWDDVRLSLPRMADFINVGPDNYAWGWLVSYLVPPNRPMAHEQWLGLPLLLMLSFLLVQGWLTLRIIRSIRAGEPVSNRDQAVFAAGIAVFIGWALMVEVGTVSLWKVVFRVVPGGSAIRAVFRYQVVLQLVVVMVTVAGLDRAFRLSRFRTVLLILLAPLVAEQFSAYRSRFDIRETNQRLAALHSPPAECRYFAIEKERDGDDRPAFHLQMEAVVISQMTGVPTINGYSANLPPFWGPQLMDVRSPGYVDAALTWISQNELGAGFCLLDLQSGTWRMPRSRWSDPRGTNLIQRDMRNFEEGMGVSLIGFYPIENAGRWTNGSGRIIFQMPVEVNQMQIRGSVVNDRAQVQILVDGKSMYDQQLQPGPFQAHLPHVGNVRRIEIVSSSFVPRALGINNDGRRLGVRIESVEVN